MTDIHLIPPSADDAALRGLLCEKFFDSPGPRLSAGRGGDPAVSVWRRQTPLVDLDRFQLSGMQKIAIIQQIIQGNHISDYIRIRLSK